MRLRGDRLALDSNRLGTYNCRPSISVYRIGVNIADYVRLVRRTSRTASRTLIMALGVNFSSADGPAARRVFHSVLALRLGVEGNKYTCQQVCIRAVGTHVEIKQMEYILDSEKSHMKLLDEC
jgi:hypothetical protein